MGRPQARSGPGGGGRRPGARSGNRRQRGDGGPAPGVNQL